MNSSIKKWESVYFKDQEDLYRNFYIRLIFDAGHRFISREGGNIMGKVLDLGAGVGYHLNFEKISKKRKYICLDSDSKKLQRIKNENVIKLCASCEKIPLKANSVDLVIASHILEHIDKLERCLSEIKRVLKKKGILIVVLPCDPGLLWRMLALFSPSRRRLKRLGISYDEVMKHEHVNSVKYCIKNLNNEFKPVKEKFFPFIIHSTNLNIWAGLVYENC